MPSSMADRLSDREMIEQDVQLGRAIYDWFQPTDESFPHPGCVEHRHYCKRKLMRTITIRACAAEPFANGSCSYDKLWDVRDYKKDRLAILGEKARLWFGQGQPDLPLWVYESIERESLGEARLELITELGWAARSDSKSYHTKLAKLMKERSLDD